MSNLGGNDPTGIFRYGEGTVVGNGAGTVRFSDLLNRLSTSITNLLGSAWVTYVPTWSLLTVGNGQVVAKYKRVGSTVHVTVALIFGSTTTVQGSFMPSLPFPQVGGSVGSAWAFDSSATSWEPGVVHTGIYYLFNRGAAARPSPSSPFVWAVNDQVHMSATYETF